MSTVDDILADVKSADDLLAKAAPVLAPLLPALAATGPAGIAITVTGEAVVVLQALVSWVEKQGNLAATLAVDAVKALGDAAEKAKFPNG